MYSLLRQCVRLPSNSRLGKPSFHTTCNRTNADQKQQQLKPSIEAIKALDGFRSRFTNSSNSEPTTHYHQNIDANQAYLTRLTLSSMLPLVNKEEEILSRESIIANGIPSGSALIPAEHLCYFTPRVRYDQLGRDGSDTSFNPPGGVFTRRMWAGGEMNFDKDNQLCINDEAWEKTFVEGAELKTIKSTGTEMIVVWVKKEIGNGKGVSLVDRRSWIFQPKLRASRKDQKERVDPSTTEMRTEGEVGNADEELPPPAPPSCLVAETSTQIKHSEPNLFRYSALTFNAHAIHLSKTWARAYEGHPGIVVHGPLNLSLLLRKWGKEKAGWTIDELGRFQQSDKITLQKIVYRAKSPLHIGTNYWIGVSSEDENKVLAVKLDGQIAMEARITTW